MPDWPHCQPPAVLCTGITIDFLGFLYANIPGSGRNLAAKVKKSEKNSKNYSETFGF